MLKISEVFQKQIRTHQERPDGTEYVHFVQAFDTRDILLNPSYIVAVQPYEFSSSMDRTRAEEAFPVGTKFVKLILDGHSFRSSEIVAVGSFDKFFRELQG
ncbi:MAG TPA: hypothetical protein DEQ32_13765 [Gammaproteobacteria bacterium]|nr:hypothetical protein [Gammaproteobacteria bacterium]